MLTKEDVNAILSITSICLLLGELLDRKFFSRERLINRMIKDAEKEGKCPICARPLKVVKDEL